MTTLMEFTNALKYLGTLDRLSFKMLLFPDSTEEYSGRKWEQFQASLISFLWSCSNDKLEIISHWLWTEHGIDFFVEVESAEVKRLRTAIANVAGFPKRCPPKLKLKGVIDAMVCMLREASE